MQSVASSVFIAVFSLALSFASATVVIGRGQCPDPGTQSGFDISRYVGDWYEYERFPNFFERGLTCVVASYGDLGGGTISVENSGLNIGPLGIRRRERSIVGSATTPDPSKPAELSVTFGGAPSSSNPNYFIVETDYDNYAVVFSCNSFLAFNIQFTWILTRAAGVAPTDLAGIKARLTAAGIDASKFILIDQSDCSV